MDKNSSKRIKVGAFVVTGTILFILAMYYIGRTRNIFGSTITVSAVFYNVNGLMPGNNVMFNGIEVGTVTKVEIISDTSIKAQLDIDEKASHYIAVSSLAAIGTDGLMGNKLVNISPGKGSRELIKAGSEFKTLPLIAMDEALRTLSRTNENLEYITKDVKDITQKFNSKNTIWSLLMDTLVAENVKQTIVKIRLASNNTAIVTGDLTSIVKDIRAGKGSIGALLTDTSLSSNLKQTVVKIKAVGDSMLLVSGDLGKISAKINKGDGLIGALVMDTNMVHSLNKSLKSVEQGTDGFNQNMEALKHNILFRKYFRKEQEKANKDKKPHPVTL